jgi:hypothetical protein
LGLKFGEVEKLPKTARNPKSAKNQIFTGKSGIFAVEACGASFWDLVADFERTQSRDNACAKKVTPCHTAY